MKKVTIITPTEYEGLILETLGKANAVQLKETSSPKFSNLSKRKVDVDFKVLYEQINSKYNALLELYSDRVTAQIPNNEAFTRFSDDPKKEVERISGQQVILMAKLQELKDNKDLKINSITEKYKTLLEEQNKKYFEKKSSIEELYNKTKVRLESVRALEPEEFRRCFAVGVVKSSNLLELKEYLKLYDDIFYKTVEVTGDEVFIFIFGSEERKKWIESLFVVYEVKDIFDYLETKDILLVLDPSKRKEVIEKYQVELKKIETGEQKDSGDLRVIEEDYKKKMHELKEEYEKNIANVENQYKKDIQELYNQMKAQLDELSTINYILRILSDDKVPVLRTKVISVLEGWIPVEKEEKINNDLKKIESELKANFYVEYSEVGKEEKAPTIVKNSRILQPFYILASMIGTPNSRELNPTPIFTLLWMIMFGFMFPDVGQGALIALMGYYFAFIKKGRMMGLNIEKVGKLFIGLGVSGIIFGFLFGEVFLLSIPALWFKPLDNNIWLMIKYAVFLGIGEIALGLLLGAVNKFRMGDPIKAIMGEKGLGGLLLFSGIIWMIFTFWRVRSLAAFMSPPIYIIILGVLTILIEPTIHAKFSHHGDHYKAPSMMDNIFEGFGGAFESVISMMSNTVSFARLAGFALAHVALGEVVHSMALQSDTLGLLGLIAMNVLAMTIEFLGAIIQSLRLLYYEFSTKFYVADGDAFKPYELSSKS